MRFLFGPPRPFRRRRTLTVRSSAGQAQSVSAASAVSSWVVSAVVVVSSVTIAASAASAAWTVPAPTVVASVTVSAGSATAAWTVPSPSVVASVIVVAGSATSTWVVPAAGMQGAQTITAASAVASWTVPAATVLASITVPATSAVASWTLPSVSVVSQVIVAAGSATSAWTVPAATVGNGIVLFPPDFFGTSQRMLRQRRRASFDGSFGARIMPGTREGRILFDLVEGTTARLDPFRLYLEDDPIDLTGITVACIVHDAAGAAVTVSAGQIAKDPDQSWNAVTLTGGRGQVYLTPVAGQFVNALSPYTLRWQLTDGASAVQFVPDAGADRFLVFKP